MNREDAMLRRLSFIFLVLALAVPAASGQLFRRPFRKSSSPPARAIQTPIPVAITPTPLPAPVPIATAPAAESCNLRVYYRSKGEPSWRVYGFYLHEPGTRVSSHLARQGYEVYLQKTTEAIPRVPPRPPEFDLHPSQTVTLAQLDSVYRALASRADIAYRYPADGCYARAHLMIRHMEALRLSPWKVWAFGNGHDMHVRTPNHPSGEVVWEYHVAPALRVRGVGRGQHWYVLDPSLFNQAVPLERWEAALAQSPKGFHPYLHITRPGQGVGRPLEGVVYGTGYWPASDPTEGLDAHALATMRKFKPFEGRTPPKGYPGAVGFVPQAGQAAAPIGLASYVSERE